MSLGGGNSKSKCHSVALHPHHAVRSCSHGFRPHPHGARGRQVDGFNGHCCRAAKPLSTSLITVLNLNGMRWRHACPVLPRCAQMAATAAHPVPWCAEPIPPRLFHVPISLLTVGIASVCVDRSNFATCEALKALGANEAPRSAYQQVARSLRVLDGFR